MGVAVVSPDGRICCGATSPFSTVGQREGDRRCALPHRAPLCEWSGARVRELCGPWADTSRYTRRWSMERTRGSSCRGRVESSGCTYSGEKRAASDGRPNAVYSFAKRRRASNVSSAESPRADFDGNRTAVRRAEQSDDDLRLPARLVRIQVILWLEVLLRPCFEAHQLCQFIARVLHSTDS